jgi:glycosyltransferase involved in cell wall biosynthesis
MNVCLFSPYLPDSSLGGGEKHLFAMARVIAKKHGVSIAIREPYFTSHQELAEKYQRFLGEPLDGIQFVPTPLRTSASFFTKLWWTKQFDHLLYWSDGSLFFTLARTNNLHLQIPFTDTKSLLDRVKLMQWQVINTNSEFTKQVIERSWKVLVTDVVYPSVRIDELATSQDKEQVILHVGRFFKQLHAKRQDVLISLFKQMSDALPSLMKGWKLVLIGAAEDPEYVHELRAAAQGYPIELHHELDRSELITWYQKAALYWHATGFGIDLEAEPEKAEHFGISTVEAMAAGAVPVVFRGGGQVEILGKELLPLSWTTLHEASETSKRLISDEHWRFKQRTLAQQRAKFFASEEFEKRVCKMIDRTSSDLAADS